MHVRFYILEYSGNMRRELLYTNILRYQRNEYCKLININNYLSKWLLEILG